MILFNIIEMSKELFFEQPVEASVREVLAKDMVDLAIDIVNYPATENTAIGDLLEKWENDYHVMGLDARMRELLHTIRKGIRSSGWDKRCMAKVEYQGPGKTFLIGRVVMDLEETFAKLHESIAVTHDDNIVEMVSDNPDLETLNALTNTSEKQTKRNLQILSGQSPSCLRDDTKRGWWGNDQ